MRMILPKYIRTFYNDITKEYDIDLKCPLYPYINDSYVSPSRFRIMQIALNSYISTNDFNKNNESVVSDWWRHWAKDNKWDIHQAMQKVMDAFQELEPVEYRTNLIKTYLSESEGKASSDISPDIREKTSRIQSQEFDLLCTHGLMPRLIICHGEDAWQGVWPWFYQRDKSKYVDVERNRCFKFNDEALDVVCIKVTHHAARRVKAHERFDGIMASKLYKSVVE